MYLRRCAVAAKRRTLNERLRDAAISHQVDIYRLGGAAARRYLSVLARADAELFSKLREALDDASGTEFQVKRLDQLLQGVWEANESAYRAAQLSSEQELRSLASYELDHGRGVFSSLASGGGIELSMPAASRAYAAAQAKPFQGRLLSEWFLALPSRRRQRIADAVRQGFVQGQTVDEIVRRLRGTKAEGYADGLVEVDRRSAEAVVRTAVAHIAAEARQALYAANADLFDEETWLSTLDGRTTDVCMSRDGKAYALPGHKPIGHDLPWLEGPGEIHWGCRSTSVPVLKIFEQLGIKLPPAERAMANGVAAGGTTYGEWLAAQPASRQDEVLGKYRAKQFRSGQIKFDRFFAAEGLLTIDELRARIPGLPKE